MDQSLAVLVLFEWIVTFFLYLGVHVGSPVAKLLLRLPAPRINVPTVRDALIVNTHSILHNSLSHTSCPLVFGFTVEVLFCRVTMLKSSSLFDDYCKIDLAAMRHA